MDRIVIGYLEGCLFGVKIGSEVRGKLVSRRVDADQSIKMMRFIEMFIIFLTYTSTGLNDISKEMGIIANYDATPNNIVRIII